MSTAIAESMALMEEIADGIFVATEYEGVNVGAIVEEKSVICIDVPSYPRDARHWASVLRRLSCYPVQYIILTDAHGDRILNTRWLNAPIVTHHCAAEKLNSYDKRYPQPLLENLMMRNPEGGRELTNNPVDRATISFSDEMTLVKNGYDIILRAAPGPTAGNSYVHIPQAGVLFTGDVVVNETHPLLAEAQSQQWLDTLAHLTTVLTGVGTVVPGRGALNNEQAGTPVVAYIDAVRARISTHLQEKRLREEVATYIPELIDCFPLGNLPRDWVQRQVRLGLERVYDEMRTEL
jgi:glyoxylase-like metal-dependent hydrolase (beta-lactamase superfamily II)